MHKNKSSKTPSIVPATPDRFSVNDTTGDETSFNKALSSLLDSSLSQCDNTSQNTSEQQLELDDDISVTLLSHKVKPQTFASKGCEAEAQTQNDSHHSHSKSSATIFQYQNEEVVCNPSKGNGTTDVNEKNIDITLKKTA